MELEKKEILDLARQLIEKACAYEDKYYENLDLIMLDTCELLADLNLQLQTHNEHTAKGWVGDTSYLNTNSQKVLN
jgi:hypothetical protein